MAGAGYKLFNTGDVLTAAQVNTYLMQQTVMVFADSSARTTALSGVLAEGMLSYLQDTNVVQVYNGSSWVAVGSSSPLTTKGDLYTYSTADARLGVGTNGQVLTADSSQATGLKWASPAGGIDYQLLSTTTLSGANTRTVSGISGKSSLYIFIDGASSASGGSGFRLRFNSDTGSNYKQFGFRVPNNNEIYRVDTSSDTSFNTADLGNASCDLRAFIMIDGTNATGIKPINCIGVGADTNGEGRILNGIYTGTSAITSVTFYTTAGNFDAGTMYIYGG